MQSKNIFLYKKEKEKSNSLVSLYICFRSMITLFRWRKKNTVLYLNIIYIYICCHPRTDCFVVSQLISVARHVGRFKLELKPAQLYIRLSIIPLSLQSTYVSSGIIRHYVVAFACLHFALLDIRVLNSYEELCIA